MLLVQHFLRYSWIIALLIEMSVADLQMVVNIDIDVDLTRSPFTPGDEGFTPLVKVASTRHLKILRSK